MYIYIHTYIYLIYIHTYIHTSVYILLLVALLVALLLTLRLPLPQVTLELPRSKNAYTYYYVAQGKQARTEARNAPRTVCIKGLRSGERLYVKDAFRSSRGLKVKTYYY